MLWEIFLESGSRLLRKIHGMGASRKLRTHRRRQMWADRAYKKSNLGNEWKKPFARSSHTQGIVLEKIGIEAKQPNSAIRKCARVQLIKNGKKIAAFVPNDGCLNYIEENDEVLIAGFGRKGHAVGDIPGVRFKVVKVCGVSLLALFKEKKEKPRSYDYGMSLAFIMVYQIFVFIKVVVLGIWNEGFCEPFFVYHLK
ncbi:40S ribosomal protein S23-like [Durio zibethinus]|uniref:S12 n=1 Tax=Durio zibethinus TaxID=66656 RepID=A0A6P6AKE1_DURZI|nr:40S ribosomal protein S23-like [Durio zibethinus]XP_022765332.1 40S ribosomal protein S23-like [Durio zibethinus]